MEEDDDVDEDVEVEFVDKVRDPYVIPSYYTMFAPFIHLHCYIYAYVHPLYMYTHHIYAIYTPNTPLNTLSKRLYTPYIRPIYTLYTL